MASMCIREKSGRAENARKKRKNPPQNSEHAPPPLVSTGVWAFPSRRFPWVRKMKFSSKECLWKTGPVLSPREASGWGWGRGSEAPSLHPPRGPGGGGPPGPAEQSHPKQEHCVPSPRGAPSLPSRWGRDTSFRRLRRGVRSRPLPDSGASTYTRPLCVSFLSLIRTLVFEFRPILIQDGLYLTSLP